MANPTGCKGQGRMWNSAGGSPTCPGCGRGPAELGAPMPRLKDGKTWWVGAVPLHSNCPTPTKRSYRSEDHAISSVPKGGPAFRPYRCTCKSWHFSTTGTITNKTKAGL